MTEETSRKPANTPTGIIAFLFTDIEGSAALWQNYPAQMDAALKRHDEIFRSNIEAKGGYVFALGGDAFSVAFNTPVEALEAVLAIQRDLFAEKWPENVEVRVRMGLHSGRAEERDGNFFGPQVNRAARLMSAGHGGQVLLSAVTYGLVRDELVQLEPEAELRYLGEHRLRDLSYTERIYQLVVSDLPEDFPPLKTHGLVTPPPEPGDLDRRYRRGKHIGGGGFADVYLVHHEALDKDMALKVPKNQYADDEQFVELFKREARNVAKLSHQNIVQVYDAGEGVFEGHEVPYMAMEYVSGGTLRHLIQRQGGPLPLRVILELTLQVAEALQVAHQSGVIHRDIKPENILLTQSGHPKVADFGIASAVSASTRALSSTAIGTPRYMSPEQAQGERASFRSDLYSLGVVLYEMLTGKVPYDAETPVGIAMKHISGHLRPPREVNPDVPEGINAVNVRLLAREPEDRYRDAAALIAVLKAVKNNPNTLVDPEGPTILDSMSTSVEVPNLIGQRAAQARGILATAGLKLGSENGAPSDTVPEGEIIEQDPSTGTKVKPDSLVSVTISTGSSTVEIPDLAGLNRYEASTTLAAAGFKLGSKNEAPSETAPEGEIIGQYPLARTKAERGSPVSITISSGPQKKKVTVPNLIGQRSARARGMLAAAGLKLGGEKEALSETAPEGEIIGQFPLARTKAEWDSPVRVTVSSGPQKKRVSAPKAVRVTPNSGPQKKKVTVPNLISQKPAEASSELTNAGLKLGAQNEAPSETAPEGEITGQYPLAQTKAERGSSVRITVSSGPEKATVPSASGRGRFVALIVVLVLVALFALIALALLRAL